MATPDAAAPAAADPAAPQDWKPEPRQWTWKDLFTAPMLAFKPKCMLISALTLIALGAWWWFFESFAGKFGPGEKIWLYLSIFIWVAVSLVVFSLGATLVSVFMRADLLDDEFLSLREALAQFRSRLVPAVLVPLFLLGLVLGVNLFLIYLPELLCSIPYAGSAIYAIFYPLGYFLGLFAVLLAIAVGLSVFVFPGIIAIRKHGWFDNVVDTIEAVGTKPHVLVGSLLLTAIMASIAFAIGMAGMQHLQKPQHEGVLIGDELQRTEDRADDVRYSILYQVDPLRRLGRFYLPWVPFAPSETVHRPRSYSNPYASSGSQRDSYQSMLDHANHDLDGGSDKPASASMHDSYIFWGTGLVTGLWKTLITAVLLGYCLNLMVGGGMLTYLLVREDDYWDDEDLEDLDKLAKELEEEAKRDEQAAAPATPVAPAPAAATPPAAPPPAPPSPPPAQA